MFVPETLMEPLGELARELRARSDPKFNRELNYVSSRIRGATHALYFAEPDDPRLPAREDLSEARGSMHTGCAQDQQQPCRRSCWRGEWAKKRVIAETGAGQHGVATATVAAMFGLSASCLWQSGHATTRHSTCSG